MEILKISKEDFNSFIDEKRTASAPLEGPGDSISGHAEKWKTIGVVKKGANFVFAELNSAAELCLDYDVTVLPPKKYFLPPKETLLKFIPKKAESYAAVNHPGPIALIGVHHYDLAAIHLMDRAFSEGERDEHYMKRRENSVLIGIYPTKHYKYRFSSSVIRGQFRKAADIMLVAMNGFFVVEILNEKGKNYLQGAELQENDFSLADIEAAANKIKDDQKIPLPIELVPEFLEKNHDHSAWDYFGGKCFSCASCVLVCPTCYCFDVRDEVDLTLEAGKRVRTWDSCMLEDFALTGEGFNFRAGRGARFRHRIYRKGKHLFEKYGYFGCVGCGRCAGSCTAGIAGPVKVLKYMLEHKQ